MNDEEIMKKFNEKFSDDNPTSTSVEKEFGDVAPYKASENNNNNNKIIKPISGVIKYS